MAEVRAYKVTSLQGVKPNSIVALKVPNESNFELYVSDLQGVPYPLKDISGGGGVIQSIVNTDGNITITGSNNLTINITPSLLSVINSALQAGDNISDLNNDAEYITISDISNVIKTNQVLIGTIDGVNNIFTIPDTIIVSTEQIFSNGVLQKKPDDYNISDSTVTFTFSPNINENLTTHYIKQ